ncbi:hypothetical protein TMEN_6676 [Trichophyton mentagrophytes]|uniref:Dynein light chain Tctex-type n=3 Tax=Trichophyton TaxID=5550 RepID=A0A9P4YDG8_9EURO|nr:dynein light chain [Trichophyton equinum CBS 127.97]EZF36465.1 hypothetical protein H101_00015 [Trichophyton interdigitale H6]KAF3891402.1 Dynein light chain Tctex-type [Trichophyton interdigitale]KDB24472.1 hypothetical protein H109_03668 [Trichophyton interdigitale MR816]GBF64007.1 hypothetical protein TMEN_6676 [Trichophyton mentagrophytes]DAA76295.1 TPA_exp: putative Dynein light chain (Tctex1) [Trichophyton benhamiae CBS 112371]
MAVEPHSSSPIPVEQLSKIAAEACDSTLEGVEQYEHEKVSEWSAQIINQVLRSLISSISSEETDKEEDSKPDPSKPTYRFNVTCTIIQQGFSSKEGSTNVEARGRRGMHCASGAYWDTKHDGMWTYKHPVAEEKGMDLVLNIVWFGSLR